jgi:hypothetical protein
MKEFEQVKSDDEEHISSAKAKHFLKETALSLYPDAYNRFSQRNLSYGVKYFCYALILSAAVLLFLFLYNFGTYSKEFDLQVDKFEKLNVVGEFDLKEPVQLINNRIVIANSMNYTNEDLLITQKSVTRKPVYCIVFEPVCWFSERYISKNVKEYSDITSYKDDFKTSVKIIFVLMLPGMILMYLLYIAIKAMALIILFSFISLIIIRIFTSFRISLKQLFLIGIYASTVMLISEPFNLLVHTLYYIPIIAFAFLFIIGINLVAEKKKHF